MSEERGQLKKRKVGLISAVGLVYSLVAAGAYGVEEMIPSSGPGLTLILLLVLPIIWGLPQSLMVSELGSALPLEGGGYQWVQRAMGEFWGFQFGWCRFLGNYLGTPAFVILVGDYAASLFGLSAIVKYILEIVVIIVVVYINIRGIKEVAMINTVISVLIIIAFGTVAIIGFMNFHQNPFEPIIPEEQSLLESLGLGLAIGMWMYMGFYSVNAVAGELENPQVIPKAILIVLPLMVLTYVFPVSGGLSSIGQWDNWGTDAVSYANVVATYGGPALGVGFVFVALISQLSMFNAYTATSPREFFVLSEDNLGPEFFAKINKKHGTPARAIVLMGVFSIVCCNFDFSAIVVISTFMLMFCIVMIAISAIMIRVKEPDLRGPFRAPLGNKGYVIMCLLPIIIPIVALYLNGTDYFVFGLAAMLSGIIVYIPLKRKYGGLNKVDPEKYPLNIKTKLAFNDLNRISLFLIILAVVGFIGVWFLPMYEDAAYYAEAYGIANFFDLLIKGLLITNVICVVSGIIVKVISRNVEVSEVKSPIQNGTKK